MGTPLIKARTMSTPRAIHIHSGRFSAGSSVGDRAIGASVSGVRADAAIWWRGSPAGSAEFCIRHWDDAPLMPLLVRPPVDSIKRLVIHSCERSYVPGYGGMPQ